VQPYLQLIKKIGFTIAQSWASISSAEAILAFAASGARPRDGPAAVVPQQRGIDIGCNR